MTSQPVVDPVTNKVILKANTLITEDHEELIENIDEVWVRTPITCETRYGVCAYCYGRDLARGHLVNEGEAVGVIAAQSIGEPGTQLTLRTFHMGGAASRSSVDDRVIVKHAGAVRLRGVRLLKLESGEAIVVSRTAEIVIADEHGRERERYRVPYGARLSQTAAEEQHVEVRETVAEWDVHSHPIITEKSGIIEYEDIVEGSSVERVADELTGIVSTTVISESDRTEVIDEDTGKPRKLRPTLKLYRKGRAKTETNLINSFRLSDGASIEVEEGSEVHEGHTLATVPTTAVRMSTDIVGGLPRVVDLFEARQRKGGAILAEASGDVSFGTETATKNRLVITNEDGTSHEKLIPKTRQIEVYPGEKIQRGDIVCDGVLDPKDILRYRGLGALREYIVDNIQEVFQAQGVLLNDKHIEIIIRQMLRKVDITDAGDSEFVKGERVEYVTAISVNEELKAEGKDPALFERVLLGITRGSLATDSFISAASFQETTKILTDAAVNSRKDMLRGLKENVIVGRLIPAGTGLAHQRKMKQEREARKIIDEHIREGVSEDETEEKLESLEVGS